MSVFFTWNNTSFEKIIFLVSARKKTQNNNDYLMRPHMTEKPPSSLTFNWSLSIYLYVDMYLCFLSTCVFFFVYYITSRSLNLISHYSFLLITPSFFYIYIPLPFFKQKKDHQTSFWYLFLISTKHTHTFLYTFQIQSCLLLLSESLDSFSKTATSAPSSFSCGWCYSTSSSSCC